MNGFSEEASLLSKQGIFDFGYFSKPPMGDVKVSLDPSAITI